ncbi:hypothetical protein AB0I28_28030 [Phytomonospora sp. NPDC050363]|uniref:hypothetical protein n=1 Tax=Phytomonospora sp. NPDC050363 TaxID=3155642 RepID=UPI00340CF252
MGRVLRRLLRPVTARMDKRVDRTAERALRGKADGVLDAAVKDLRARNARGLDEVYDALTALRAELAEAREEIAELRRRG